jgi:hypothetical protein
LTLQLPVIDKFFVFASEHFSCSASNIFSASSMGQDLSFGRRPLVDWRFLARAFLYDFCGPDSENVPRIKFAYL